MNIRIKTQARQEPRLMIPWGMHRHDAMMMSSLQRHLYPRLDEVQGRSETSRREASKD